MRRNAGLRKSLDPRIDLRAPIRLSSHRLSNHQESSRHIFALDNPLGVGEQTEICTEISAGLPKHRRMEKQSVQTGQRTKIGVNRSPKPVPPRESLLLLAFNVPERIADVLRTKRGVLVP
jgi:hypothetical protein